MKHLIDGRATISVMLFCIALSILGGLHPASPHVIISDVRWDAALSLTVLPNHPLAQTIITTRAQSVDVTVARLPEADVLLFARDWPTTDKALDSRAMIVWHKHYASNGTTLEHRVVIPALPMGLYQVQLETADRTAIQHINVTTLGAAVVHQGSDSVLMGLDLRTMRHRGDVKVHEYFGRGKWRSFAPSSDGLVHFPYPWNGLVEGSPETGMLLAMAPDGSVAVVSPGWSQTFGSNQYFETDRVVYRPGDIVRYRYISREKRGSDVLSFVKEAPLASSDFGYVPRIDIVNGVGDGSFSIPKSAKPGPYSDFAGTTIFVANTARSRYELEAGPITPIVRQGAEARFIISTSFVGGKAAPGVEVWYGWHYTTMAEAFPIDSRLSESLTFRMATTDKDGNAVVSVPAQNPGDIEMFAYDPDTDEIAAIARAKAVSAEDSIDVWASPPWEGARCVPLAVHLSEGNGASKAARRVRITVQPETLHAGPSPAPVFIKDVVTGNSGYAVTKWCSNEEKGWTATVRELDVRGLTADSDIWPPTTSAPGGLPEPALLIFPQSAQPQFGRKASIEASSTNDGDAIVRFGSDRKTHAQIANIQAGKGQFDVTAPAEGDDFGVSVTLFTAFATASSSTAIQVSPKMHMLHVTFGCTAATYDVSRPMNMCVHVSNWEGKGVLAKVFASMTETTRAGIAAALTQRDAVYHSLFDPGDTSRDDTVSWHLTPGWTPKEYLYPLPSPTPVRSRPPLLSSPAASEGPQSIPSFGPQTIAWVNGITTKRDGSARLHVSWPAGAPSGVYLIHAIALTDNGCVGDGFAWVRFAR